MKNLVNFKVALKTREYLVQAIYQMFFNNQNPIEIIEQFKKEHKLQKVDFENFSESLISINKYKEEFKKILIYLEIQDKDINLLDKSIIYFAINELNVCSFKSRTVRSNPFLRRFPASLPPTLPRPMNPIFILFYIVLVKKK